MNSLHDVPVELIWVIIGCLTILDFKRFRLTCWRHCEVVNDFIAMLMKSYAQLLDRPLYGRKTLRMHLCPGSPEQLSTAVALFLLTDQAQEPQRRCIQTYDAKTMLRVYRANRESKLTVSLMITEPGRSHCLWINQRLATEDKDVVVRLIPVSELSVVRPTRNRRGNLRANTYRYSALHVIIYKLFDSIDAMINFNILHDYPNASVVQNTKLESMRLIYDYHTPIIFQCLRRPRIIGSNTCTELNEFGFFDETFDPPDIDD